MRWSCLAKDMLLQCGGGTSSLFPGPCETANQEFCVRCLLSSVGLHKHFLQPWLEGIFFFGAWQYLMVLMAETIFSTTTVSACSCASDRTHQLGTFECSPSLLLPLPRSPPRTLWIRHDLLPQLPFLPSTSLPVLSYCGAPLVFATLNSWVRPYCPPVTPCSRWYQSDVTDSSEGTLSLKSWWYYRSRSFILLGTQYRCSASSTSLCGRDL